MPNTTMPLAKIQTAATAGIDAYPLELEVDISGGEFMFTMVGLPDAAVRESRERVATAVKNCDFSFPLSKRIVVNFAPAETKKEGPIYDLPLAVGILAAQGDVKGDRLRDFLIVGELSLDGKTRRINGALPITLLARKMKKRGIVLPLDNAEEAALVEGVDVYPAEGLEQTARFLNGEDVIAPYRSGSDWMGTAPPPYTEDFADVKGQETAKRALEIAAAGNHNVIMVGPPGSGKTMLARRLPGILPDMTLEECIEVTKIYSVSGHLNSRRALVRHRPFRSPHHTISNVALIGGGAFPRPGEVSLGHHGVLFLDELPEFKREALEALRQPLEDGEVVVSRAQQTATFPCVFLLAAALNPCPCGWLGDYANPCVCSAAQIQKYMKKISGPLLDRIDIHIEAPRVEHEKLSDARLGESSGAIRERVNRARARQTVRYRGEGIFSNAQLTPALVRKHCRLSPESEALLKAAIQKFGLTARAYDRIKKVARTVADLAAAENVETEHVAEAVTLRSLDRRRWG